MLSESDRGGPLRGMRNARWRTPILVAVGGAVVVAAAALGGWSVSRAPGRVGPAALPARAAPAPPKQFARAHPAAVKVAAADRRGRHAPRKLPREIRLSASGESVRGGVIHVAVAHARAPEAMRFEVGPAPPKPAVSVACGTCRGNVIEVRF